MKHYACAVIVAAALLAAAAAHAISLNIPTTTISGVNVFSGPTFVVSGNYGLSDLVSVEGIGTVDLAFGNFTANAAGVITAPPVTNTGNNPGQTSPALAGSPLPGAPYAAVLIGNATLGFHVLFAADASAGLGSAAPPTDIFATRTIGDIFGAAIANGTVLEFRINDINTFDNSGSFTIKSVAVPDSWGVLSSLVMPLALWIALLRFRRNPLLERAPSAH